MSQSRGPIQRPPFYRPPRSRPVTFEEPAKRGPVRGAGHQQVSSERMSAQSSQGQGQLWHLVDLPSHNRAPQPFVSRHGERPSRRFERDHYQVEEFQAGPTQQVSTRAVAPSSYPTSTVHKSMLTSRRQLPAPQPLDGGLSTGFVGPSQAPGASWAPAERPTDRSHAEPSSRWEDWAGPAVVASRDPMWPLDFSQAYGANHDASPVSRAALEPEGHSRRLLSGLAPDSKRAEFEQSKQLECASIAHQTYRTLPIVSPKPKALHDLATGSYMRFNRDPTWDLAVGERLARARAREHLEHHLPSGQWGQPWPCSERSTEAVSS